MSIDVNVFLFSLMIYTIIMNIGISLYAIFQRPNKIKKIIALTILGDSANVLAIIVGYRAWPSPNRAPIPPVLTNLHPTGEDIQMFTQVAVDPLPQALVLTAVVIGLAVTVFLVFLALQLYRLYGTLDVRKITKLRG